METVTTILSADPPRQTLAPSVTTAHQGPGSGALAGKIMSEAFAAAGLYAQRAGATWVLWLRTNADKPPHEDF